MQKWTAIMMTLCGILGFRRIAHSQLEPLPNKFGSATARASVSRNATFVMNDNPDDVMQLLRSNDHVGHGSTSPSLVEHSNSDDPRSEMSKSQKLTSYSAWRDANQEIADIEAAKPSNPKESSELASLSCSLCGYEGSTAGMAEHFVSDLHLALASLLIDKAPAKVCTSDTATDADKVPVVSQPKAYTDEQYLQEALGALLGGTFPAPAKSLQLDAGISVKRKTVESSLPKQTDGESRRKKSEEIDVQCYERSGLSSLPSLTNCRINAMLQVLLTTFASCRQHIKIPNLLQGSLLKALKPTSPQ